MRLGERIRRDGASSKCGGLIVMPTCRSSAEERGAVQCGVAVPLYDLGHMKAGAAAHSSQETPLIPVLTCGWCEHKRCLHCPPVDDGCQWTPGLLTGTELVHRLNLTCFEFCHFTSLFFPSNGLYFS